MVIKGRTFIWAPEGKFICLYSVCLRAPQIYARVSKEDGIVALELTSEAIQLGIIEECVASAFLLQCGRTID
ncbi:hypothetical protein B0H19DRAFT_975176, partial [Mycena capillaripes]